MKRSKTILIGDALNEFFSRPYVAARVAEGDIENIWRSVVGNRIADFTTSLRFDNRVLYVTISSSLLRSEVFAQRNAIMNQINTIAKVRIANVLIVK